MQPTDLEINNAIHRKLGRFPAGLDPDKPHRFGKLTVSTPYYCNSLDESFKLLAGFKKVWFAKTKKGWSISVRQGKETVSGYYETLPRGICLTWLRLYK